MDLVQLQLRGTPNSTQDQEVLVCSVDRYLSKRTMQEVQRRRSSLMYYLLRDPIYDKYTK